MPVPRHPGIARIRVRSAIGIESNATPRWRSANARALREIVDAGTIDAGHAVCLGDRELEDGKIRVLPVASFPRALSDGEILRAPSRR